MLAKQIGGLVFGRKQPHKTSSIKGRSRAVFDKRISSISGVGKKMAERIVVELRHKISAGEALEAVAGGKDGSPIDSKLRDAMMALVALGYKQDDAHKKAAAVLAKHVGKALTVEDIIKQALSK